MTKKEYLVTIAIIALTAVFALVPVMVYLSNGKSKKWIARKMKIGGLLLTLTAVSCNSGRQATCYDTEALNFMSLKNAMENKLEINLDTGNILLGHILGRRSNEFSFSIADKTGRIL